MSITMTESYFYRNVLVVDDHNMNQLLMAAFLENYCSINVEFANNGQEAVELVDKKDFDLIFMDINMPIMDGIEATRIIKRKYPNMPVVAVTANNIDQNRAECFLAGMDDFLAKPISHTAIEKVIHRYFNKQAVI